MGEGAETPDGADPGPDAPEQHQDAAPDETPQLVRPYIARHYHGAHADDEAGDPSDGGEPADRHASGLSTVDLLGTVDLRRVWADDEPATADAATTAELPAVIDITMAAASDAERSADRHATGEGGPRRAGRALAVVGAAVVVLLAIAATVWAVGGRSDGEDLVLVVQTPTATPTSTPRRTPAVTLTPTASPSPTRTRPPASASPSTAASTTPAATTSTTTTGPPTTPPPTTQPPPGSAVTGTVYSTAITPRRCVDVRAANTAPGTPVQGYDCNGTGAQSVTFTTAGTMQILGRCVQPQNGSLTVNTLIVINDCVGGNAAQQWRVNGGAVRHLASNLCLGLPNANPANSVQLRLETCNGSTGQRWTAPL